MLAMSVRVRPCSALSRASSDGRVTLMDSFSTATPSPVATKRVNSPLGPFTFTSCPSTVTVTPFGTGTGSFPIRDIVTSSSPHQGDELAAGVRLTCIAIGHEALGRAQNRHAQAIAHPRNLTDANVFAQARGGHALQLPDDGLS